MRGGARNHDSWFDSGFGLGVCGGRTMMESWLFVVSGLSVGGKKIGDERESRSEGEGGDGGFEGVDERD